MTARPETPDPVKRVLRQEACFGCCACGNPIFQYQHIIEYATDPHFRPEDMMVLCPEHHNQATQRVLDEAVQRAMKAKPFNCERRLASGQLSVRQRTTDVDLGGHRFAATAVLVAVDGEPLLTTGVSQFGTLLLGLRLHDRDDNLVAHVVENEWVSEDPLPWDIEFAYRRLTIRSAPRQIELNIDAGVEPVRIRGSLWRKGQHILIDNEGLHAGGAHMIGRGTLIGLAIELDAAAAGTSGFRLVPHPPTATAGREPLRRFPEPARNEKCPCGSGLKFKRCHGLR